MTIGFADLKKQVVALPILQVIGSVTQVYDARKEEVCYEDLARATTGQYYAYCPFHNDDTLGSFVITPERNIWWCFSEGIGWSGIDFEERYFNLKFKDAVYHLATRFSLITEEDYNRYAQKKIAVDVVRSASVSVEKPKDKPARKADQDIIDMVYSAIPRVCSLTAKHKQHLLKERGLSAKDLEDYFTFPTRNMDLAAAVYRECARVICDEVYSEKKLMELTKEEKIELEKDERLVRLRQQFIYIPGFFFDGRSIDFASYKGIGFLVKDHTGKAVGIQIRRDTVRDGESRYVWFSSAFAAGRQGYNGGSSPGAPGGVIRSKIDTGKVPSICITEGRFKAEKIAAKGMTAIYVSGVSSWKNIMYIVRALKARHRYIYVAFDADLMGNTAVHGQLKELCFALEKEGLIPKLVLWPIDRGKGFDDLVRKSGQAYKEHLSYMEFKDFEDAYKKALEIVLKMMDAKDLKEIEKERRTEFTALLQRQVERFACGQEKP